MANGTRWERDSLGEVEVEAARLWGAQTQRSLTHFRISTERMPGEVISALVQIKRAAASVNRKLGVLDERRALAIIEASDEILSGKHPDEFPLSLWQTGSGTQSNMNVNEVLANRASEILGGKRGQERVVDPNDHVNRSQSSNDVFSAAMNLACLAALRDDVLPALRDLRNELHQKALDFADIIKVGRTHLQDATPITLGQECSGWVAQIDHGIEHIESALGHLSQMALGGTAVGTGLNAPMGYAERIAQELSKTLQLELVSAPNKFEAQAAHDALVFAHGALKTVAASMNKIANDVRWLASGPRCGLGELLLPANEPGSSIMPGKVNPTQCEALTMCCAQVFGNDVTINFAGASGNFELNVYKPVLVHCFLQSARLLAGGAAGFSKHLVKGLEPNRDVIARHLERSLMLVTALAPEIGYEKSARIAKRAHEAGITLRLAALQSGDVSGEDFDRLVDPKKMLGRG